MSARTFFQPVKHWPLASILLPAILILFHRIGRFGIARAPEVLALSRFLDKDPYYGVCYMGASFLPEIPTHICSRSLELHDITRCNFPSLSPCMPIFSPPNSAPLVSVIMTVHNKAQLAAQAVLELAIHASEANGSIEFCIVDDGSSTSLAPLRRVLEALERYCGIPFKYKRNSAPVGFTIANNQAAAMATGEFLLFANIDMFVTPGALALLLATMHARPDAAAVGPLFIGARHIVQEAGSVVWKDATGANVGRGRDLDPLLYRLRPTDYISAACLLVRHDAFRAVGGFDERFAPAYFEDTDLAMGLRERGYQTLLQPLAVVYHQEGSVYGSGSSPVKQNLMNTNRKRFRRKWASQLEAHLPSFSSQFSATMRISRASILWVDSIVPEPDRDSGSQRTFLMLQALVDNGYAIFYVATSTGRLPKYQTALRAMGVSVLPYKPSKWKLRAEGSCMFDMAIVARLGVFEATHAAIKAECPDIPIIYDTVDLHFLREARDFLANQQTSGGILSNMEWRAVTKWLDAPSDASTKKNHDYLRKLRNRELSAMRKANLTLVVSKVEAELLTHEDVGHVDIVSNIYRLAPIEGVQRNFTDRHGAIFVGNLNHFPNQRAIMFLLENLEKLIAGISDPAFRLHVVGANSLPPLLQLSVARHRSRVDFHYGISPTELTDLYRQVRIAVAPLFSGAGVKGKVAEAWIHGVPLVATPIAVEGMHGVHGRDYLMANTTDEFFQMFFDAYNDSDLWGGLVGGREVLQSHFTYEKASATLFKWIEKLRPRRTVGMMTKIRHTLLSAFSSITSYLRG